MSIQFIRNCAVTALAITALASGALLSGCGVAGDKGAAVFHVGNNWQKGVEIAAGSTFAVNAQRNDLTQNALTVKTNLPAVVQLAGGNFQAAVPGLAQFEADDPTTQALVDTVEFNVATPASVALGPPWANMSALPTKLAKNFGLVHGTHYVGAIVVDDVAGARLNHSGIASVNCANLQIKVVDDAVEATPTTLGPCTATVAVQDAAGKVSQSAQYTITVVELTDITGISLTSVSAQNGWTTPADPDKGPVAQSDADAKTAAKSAIFVLSVAAALADATPVYGPTTTWSESGSNHLLAKQSSGGNYAVLKSGETVTVTATVGNLSKDIKLVAP